MYGRAPGRPSSHKRITWDQFVSRPLTDYEQRFQKHYLECRARGVAQSQQQSKELEHTRIWNDFLGHAYTMGDEVTTENTDAVAHGFRLVSTAVAYHTAGNVKAYIEGREPEDDQFAKALSPLTDWWWQLARMRRVLIHAFVWRKTLGGAYVKTVWDPHYYHDSDRGEVSADAVDPRFVWYDPALYSSDIQDAMWWGHDMIRDTYRIARCYGIDFGEFDSEKWQDVNTLTGSNSGYAAQLTATSGATYEFTSGMGRSQLPRIPLRVTEFYLRTAKRPRGIVGTFINDIPVPGSIRDNPMPDGSWPIVGFPDNPWENRPIGRSSYYMCMPLFTAYNHCMSIMSDWRDVQAQPTLIAAQDTQIADEKLRNYIRKVLRPLTSEQAAGMRYLENPQMSEVPHVQSQELQSLMDVIFGVNSIALQSAPQNGVSGQALRILAEANEQRQGVDREIIEPGLEGIMRNFLKLALKYYSGKRVMRLNKPGDSREFMMLTSNQETQDGEPVANGRRWFDVLRWKEDGDYEVTESYADPELDLRIATGSIMPASPAVIQQDLADLWSRYPDIPTEIKLKYDLKVRAHLPEQEILDDYMQWKKQQEESASQAPPEVSEKANIVSNSSFDRNLTILAQSDPAKAAGYADQAIQMELTRLGAITEQFKPKPPPQEQGAQDGGDQGQPGGVEGEAASVG